MKQVLLMLLPLQIRGLHEVVLLQLLIQEELLRHLLLLPCRMLHWGKQRTRRQRHRRCSSDTCTTRASGFP